MAILNPAGERTPGRKLFTALLVAMLLAIPLFTVYLLTWDRQSQSETANASIAQGWGGPQTIAGPMLVVPYEEQSTETVTENNRPVTRTITAKRNLFIAPSTVKLTSDINPERRKKSIYEVVVYDAVIAGRAEYRMPADLARIGVPVAALQWARAELRFGVGDPRGLKPANRVSIGGQPVASQPGNGLNATGGAGFFVAFDASGIASGPLTADFHYELRGNSTLALEPNAGATTWTVRSRWPHPNFGGGFLPEGRNITADGFQATYQISNLALGTTLASTSDVRANTDNSGAVESPYVGRGGAMSASPRQAQVGLMQPVDLYDQVNRSVKYGFLFIGFTFVAFLLFDVIAGVRVAAVEYLLVGAGLVLFFVLLLAFAEVIGFTPAYLLASAAIIALLAGYSAAVLKSSQRGGIIAGLLTGLYAVLYVLLSLEAYSLLIGSVLLFVALAGIMYLTRNLDWSGLGRSEGVGAS